MKQYLGDGAYSDFDGFALVLTAENGIEATDDNAIVREVLPSFYWPLNAIVIITECGHRHLRPNTMQPSVGATFHCPLCVAKAEGGTPAPQTPEPEETP